MKRLAVFLTLVFALTVNPAMIQAGWLNSPSGSNPIPMAAESSLAKGKKSVFEYQAKSMIGKPVENKQGDYLGSITDLMISLQNDGITFAVVSHGGVLGIPMRFVAVPLQSLMLSPGKNSYLLNVSKERMAAAPSFNRGDWPDAADLNWERNIYRYYGQTPQWEESGGSIMEGQDQAIRFIQIAGAAVINEKGKEIGKIENIIIDPQGHVSYAVVSHGGFLGIDAKLVGVPFSALKFDKRETQFILNATAEKLDSAPGFKPSALTDKNWIEATRRVFAQ